MPGGDGLDILHLVRMHPRDPADFHFPSVSDIDDGGAFGNHALVYADIGKLAVLPIFELEGKGDDRFFRVCRKGYHGLVVVHIQGFVIHIRRARKKLCHAVE